MEYLTDPNPDNVMILVTPRLEPASLNTKWFKSLESTGAFIQIWPVDARALPRWIDNRMTACGIRADQDTIALLADRVEGNLLAADQEITKLRILTGASSESPISISRKQVMNLVADSSRYNVFSLVDSALLGDTRRCLKILAGLRSEGSDVLGILAILTRELRILIAISRRISKGQSINNAMQQERVRKNHEVPVSNALQRLTAASLQAMLQHARLVDQSVKGLANAEPWAELTTILLKLCGTPLRMEVCTD
jgi:DNA polymerase-3 subunit delta